MMYHCFLFAVFQDFRANDYFFEFKLARNNVFGCAASWRRIRTP